NPAAAADFAGGTLPSGSLTFNAAETSKVVTVNVNGDTAVEPDEAFTVTLSGPVGATITTASAAGSIVNDDGLITLTLSPRKDNTLVQDASGSLSNGAGDVYVGINSTGTIAQRGLLSFDLAGSIPAGATIQSATLTMYLAKSQVGDRVVELHKALADWGEAGSTGAGNGAPAQAGDATWLNTFFSSQFWTSPGGDFSPTESAAQAVGAEDTSYAWSSTPQMVADLQGWLDRPGTNFGWLLKGDEGQNSSKRFASRESTDPAQRPSLTITYTLAPPPELSISDARLAEGKSKTVLARFKVRLSSPSNIPVTVNYATADGSAVAGSDYRATSGQLTFSPGETSKTVWVRFLGDRVPELTESFLVNLSEAQNAKIADGQGVGTIANDDQGVSLMKDGSLLVVGGNARDSISFAADSQGQISARYNDKSFGPYDVTGRILAYGMKGDDQIALSSAISRDAVIDGGEGNDVLYGGSGNDRLYGGLGNDRLHGGNGNDWLFGDDGNDKLYGKAGNDALLGGQGNDVLDAGAGRNLLIGGLGKDDMKGGSGENILIGGTTVYDKTLAALETVMAEWTSPRSFVERTGRLDAGLTNPTLGSIRLKRSLAPGDGLTVSDDRVRDVFSDASTNDWLFDFSPWDKAERHDSDDE
ncbi:MAG: Calx-beta domain-containing protein, partial [Thermoguttaceae bacterium]